MTPSALGRRYAPFLALAAVQVLLVAVVPSKAPDLTTAGAVSGGATGLVPGADNGIVGGVPAGASGSSGSFGSSGAPGAVPSGPAGGTSGEGGGGKGGGAGATQNADMSNCDEDGRQIGPVYHMPVCKPKWPQGADNGGATMTGVTATEIRYVYYVAKSDEQVDQIFATQNLAATPQDRCLSLDAFHKVVNKRWELYGRKFVSLDGSGSHKGSARQSCNFPYYQGQCRLTPPDPPCNRAEARDIAAMKPAYVIAPVANEAFYNELGKLRIVVAGGGSVAPAPIEYHTVVAPYFWDVLMNGTHAADIFAEYWCKRLDGKPVKWAGVSVTDPDTNPVTPPPTRKLGIAYPVDGGTEINELNVKRAASLMRGGMCGSSSTEIEFYKYESDINTAQQQAATIAAAVKDDGVTTFACWCDPVAPAFLTTALDQQNYHPEHLLTGMGLIDYDLVGRLYSPTQWRHAFGPSHLPIWTKFEESDAAKAWRDAGNPGSPGDRTSSRAWAYYNLMADSFHYAGPQPTPDNIRHGLFTAPPRGGWEESGGDPRQALLKFGSTPDDYTRIDDAREAWWNPSRPSEVDGKPGSYQSVDGGRRYARGQWPTGDPKVFE